MIEKFQTQYNRIVQIVSTMIIVLIIFGIGYYVGFKNGFLEEANSTSQVQENIIENDKKIIDIERLANEDEDLKLFVFIKPNEPKVCVSPFTIKAVYRDGFGYFYDSSNTFYDRVKPDLCFVSVEAARDYAGFIQKF